MPEPQLPTDFIVHIRQLFGEAGAAWLQGLPELIETCSQRWSIQVLEPYTPLSYNYAARARGAGGEPLVLKLGIPHPELVSEIAALQHFDGDGMVRLVQADASLGALLLERLEPGTPLREVADEEQATRIAAGVMQQLWKPISEPHPFPSAAKWGRGFERLRAEFGGGTGPFDKRMVSRAEGLFAELLASAGAPVLLHGDLHHWNILAAQRQPWLALDPKGVVGEPAYETGALLRNPFPHLLEMQNPRRMLRRRADMLAELLGFDRQRISGWAFSQAVLSAWWSYEDHESGLAPWLGVAELLEDI